MLYKNNSLVPQWKYEGKGGERQICRIYGYSCTLAELETFFGDSSLMLNQSYDSPLQWGYELLYCHTTGQYLDFYGRSMDVQGGQVRYQESMKENAHGEYYEGLLEIDPDSDSMERWLQELNSHQRPTIFVIEYTQGGGRVLGNRNGGLIFSNKFSSGGKKSAQDRTIQYKWSCHHPAFFYAPPDGLVFRAGFIKASSGDGHYFTDVASCEAYFSDKFDTAPYHFFPSGINANEFYFRVPRGTAITGSIFSDANFLFSFEDLSGLIEEISATNLFIGSSNVLSNVSLKDIKKMNATNAFLHIDMLIIQSLFIPSGSTIAGCFIRSVTIYNISRLTNMGTISNSFCDMETCMVGNMDNKGQISYSFKPLGTPFTALNYIFVGDFRSQGQIYDSFLGIQINILSNLLIHRNADDTDTITNSFNNNSKLWANEVELFTHNMTVGFQNNSNVVIKSILTSNKPSHIYIMGYFRDTVNLTIKRWLGTTVANDNIADAGGNTGFQNCSGTLRFQAGYDTINGGGIEGDVAQIIANASGTPTILYNQ